MSENRSLVLLNEWQVVANRELLSIANPHWLQFRPPSCVHHSIIAVIYVFLVVPGILGNLVMIVTFFASPSLRNHANLMSANLSFADLLLNLEIPFLIRNSLTCGPRYFSPTACRLYGLTGGLSGTVAIACIACMAIQRLIKISRPFNEGDLMNRRTSIMFVIGTWIYGLVFSLFPFFYPASAYTPEGYLTSCSFDYLNQDLVNRIYILVFFFAAYLVPLAIILYCYVRIGHYVHDANRNLIALHKRSSGIPSSVARSYRFQRQLIRSSPCSSRNSVCSVTIARPESAASHLTISSAQVETIARSKMMMEKRLMKSVVILILNWTIAWTPYALISLAGIFSYSEFISPIMSMMPALLAKTASVIDPYIYFLSHPRYKREVTAVFSKASKWSRDRRSRASISLSRIATIIQRKRTDSAMTPSDETPNSPASASGFPDREANKA